MTKWKETKGKHGRPSTPAWWAASGILIGPLAFILQIQCPATPRCEWLGRIFPFPILHPPTGGGAREAKRKRRYVGDHGGRALLAGSGDDLHRILQHLRCAGPELPQGALQVRGRVPREGPFLHLQVGGRQAREAQWVICPLLHPMRSCPPSLILDPTRSASMLCGTMGF